MMLLKTQLIHFSAMFCIATIQKYTTVQEVWNHLL